MKSKELALRRLLPAAVVLGLGLTACGDAGSDNDDIVARPGDVATQEANGGVNTEITYYPNGTRTVVVKSMVPTVWSTDIIMQQFCEGPYLTTLSEQAAGRGAAGSVTPPVEHPACADDGRLDPSDFQFRG